MQLKKISNTLKKVQCSDDKITQRVHNKRYKSHLWGHFIILILTRTGLHKKLLSHYEAKVIKYARIF